MPLPLTAAAGKEAWPAGSCGRTSRLHRGPFPEELATHSDFPGRCPEQDLVYVLEDCVAGTSPQGHDAALAIMRALTNAGRAVTAADAIAAPEVRAKDIGA